MRKKGHVISSIEPGSIADQLELEPGDILLKINGKEVEDVFDYHFFVNDACLVLLVQKENGEEWELEIEKDPQEDLGITFENGLMDDYKSCSNKCIFCFIDQMPPGMRETLYFKDDDSRLSFLQGNYVTLTNMKEHDLERIIAYKLAPINISVHTTNPELRCRMLHNRFAGEALKKIDRLYEAGIEMNGQIVCCKGINDGEELDRTIRDLVGYIPCMESLSVVPLGMTKYREGLCPLEPFDRDSARAVVAIIEKWQNYCMEHFQTHFVQASDEWYLLADLPLPEEERYDGYIQLENGVGMLRLLITEFTEALEDWVPVPVESPAENKADTIGSSQAEEQDKMRSENKTTAIGTARTVAREKELLPSHRLTVATGRLAAPFLKQLAEAFMERQPGIQIDVLPIRNDFFGETITVSGLITGQDLVKQLQEKKDREGIGEKVLIPVNMLRSGEHVFLDDMTMEEAESALQVPFGIVKSSGFDLLEAFTECFHG